MDLATGICSVIYYKCIRYVYVTWTAKKDQVSTKYIISPKRKYLKFCVQYSLSVTFEMLPIKFFIDSENFASMALEDY